jgi:hypothetical protein
MLVKSLNTLGYWYKDKNDINVSYFIPIEHVFFTYLYEECVVSTLEDFKKVYPYHLGGKLYSKIKIK